MLNVVRFRVRFPYKVRNFGDLETFSIIFCILNAEYPPYFYFRFVWHTDLESIPHASTPTVIIFTKFEVDVIIHCQVKVFCLAIRYVTLWPWTVVTHDGSRDQPATNFEIHTLMRSWVIRYLWYHWPLALRFWLLRMRCITWPVRRGKFYPHIWNPQPRFVHSLCYFVGSAIKVNKSSMPK